MPNSVYILLGGNLGDRRERLLSACFHLENKVGKLVRSSSVYETEAWGVRDQPSFYNQVLCIETDLSPEKVLQHCLNIEIELGRKRHRKWYARTIDIDILYYENLVIKSRELTLPHPFLHQRRFTMVPLEEIAPFEKHPLLLKTNRELLEECPDSLEVRLVDEAACAVNAES